MNIEFGYVGERGNENDFLVETAHIKAFVDLPGNDEHVRKNIHARIFAILSSKKNSSLIEYAEELHHSLLEYKQHTGDKTFFAKMHLVREETDGIHLVRAGSMHPLVSTSGIVMEYPVKKGIALALMPVPSIANMLEEVSISGDVICYADHLVRAVHKKTGVVLGKQGVIDLVQQGEIKGGDLTYYQSQLAEYTMDRGENAALFLVRK